MAKAFAAHSKAAASAFSSGDFTKAAHHTGHMLLHIRNAKRASAPTGAPEGPSAATAMSAAQAGSDDDMSQSQPPQGIATPEPTPASGQHFFGQFPKKAPKAKPHVAPASQIGATNHAPSGGFNKGRFAAMLGKK